MRGKWSQKTRLSLWGIGLLILVCTVVGLTLQSAVQARKDEMIDQACGPDEPAQEHALSDAKQTELDRVTSQRISSKLHAEQQGAPKPPISIGINLMERQLTIYSE